MSASNNSYTALDLEVLKASQGSLGTHAARAEAFSIKYAYLPGVLDSFKRLRRNVDSAAHDLQNAALVSRQDLEYHVRKLRNLKAEWDSPNAETREIEEDLAKALKNMFISTLTHSSKVRSCLDDIRTGYDKGALSDFSDGLQRDKQRAEEARKKLEQDLEKNRADLKVLSDATAALNKAGFDKLNQKVELTIDKLQGLGLAPPEAQLVALAIDQLKRSLKDLTEAINYILMIRESDALQVTVNRLVGEFDQKDREIDQASGKSSFLVEIRAMDDQREKYASQYQKADEAFQNIRVFAEANRQGEVIARTAAAIVEADRFIAFLTPVCAP